MALSNEFHIDLVGSLDQPKSRDQINKDIETIKKSLNSVELTATISSESLTDIKKQLDNLKVSLSDVTIPQQTLNRLVDDINNALSGIQIPNINISPNAGRRAGSQAAEAISAQMKRDLQRVSSPEIDVDFAVDPGASASLNEAIKREIEKLRKNANTVVNVTYTTNTQETGNSVTDQFGNELAERVEVVTGAVFKYTSAAGEAITKTMQWGKIGTDEFGDNIEGWIQGTTRYTNSVEQSTTTLANFADKQKMVVSNYESSLSTIQSRISDRNVAKPLKDTAHISDLNTQIGNVTTAITNLRNASSSTFTDMRVEVERQITTLINMERQYRNAENIATSLRSKDFNTVKNVETQHLDKFIEKVKNSKITVNEFESGLATLHQELGAAFNVTNIQGLRDSLINATDKNALVEFLNLLDIAEAKFNALVAAKTTANTTSKYQAEADVLKSTIRIFADANPQAKNYSRTIEGTTVNIAALNTALENVASSDGVRVIAKQFEAWSQAAIAAGVATKGTVSEYERLLKNANKAIDTNSYAGKLSTVKTQYSNLDQSLTNGQLKEDYTELIRLAGMLNTTMSDQDKVNTYKQIEILLPSVKNRLTELLTTQSQLNQFKDIKLFVDGGLDSGGYETKLNTLSENFRKLGLTQDQVQEKVKKVVAAYEELKKTTDKPFDQNTFQNVITLNDRLQQELKESGNQYQRLKAESSEFVSIQQRLSLANQIEAWNQKNSRATKEVKAENESYIASLRNLNQQITKMQFNQLVTGFKKTENSMRAMNRLGASLKNQIKQAAGSFAQWLSVSRAVMLVVSSIKNSVNDLKEVDTYITEISKANDQLTKQQLTQIGDDSFEVASKYGKKAADYLAGVQEMSRAGYMDALGMAELSVAAQGAGDMTADLSNQMIVAVDKAYKLNGAVEDVTAVLDGMNYITNHNATNMTDLSEGMTIVASTAASFGVDIDELTAALGTMSATTQQSGSEVARAFKAILLNIRQVSDEEEGIDAEGLTKYENACKALGVSLKETKDGVLSLRDPMEVLKDLSEEYNKLEENDIRRTDLLNSVGGKLRATQLDALLRQWDTYETMLQQYEDGAGSMQVEAAKTAESWEGSLNRLKNSFTDTVGNIVKSDFAIEFLNQLNNLVTGINKVTEALGPLASIGVGAGLFGAFKNVGNPKMFGFIV